MNRQLRRAMDEFAREIEAIVSQLVRREVAAAVKNHGGVARAPRAATADVDTSEDSPAGRRRKRSPRQLENATRKLHEYIQAHPDERMEQISKGIGIRTGLLQPLIKKLLSERLIKARGKARGTTYTVT
jgi:hypothetical protein